MGLSASLFETRLKLIEAFLGAEARITTTDGLDYGYYVSIGDTETALTARDRYNALFPGSVRHAQTTLGGDLRIAGGSESRDVPYEATLIAATLSDVFRCKVTPVSFEEGHLLHFQMDSPDQALEARRYLRLVGRALGHDIGTTEHADPAAFNAFAATFEHAPELLTHLRNGADKYLGSSRPPSIAAEKDTLQMLSTLYPSSGVTFESSLGHYAVRPAGGVERVSDLLRQAQESGGRDIVSQNATTLYFDATQLAAHPEFLTQLASVRGRASGPGRG